MRNPDNETRIAYLEREISEAKIKASNKEAYRKKKVGGIVGVSIGAFLLFAGIIIICLCWIPIMNDESAASIALVVALVFVGTLVLLGGIVGIGVGTPNIVMGSIRYTKACNAENSIPMMEDEIKRLKEINNL